MTARCEDCGKRGPFTCGGRPCVYPFDHRVTTCTYCHVTRCGECHDLRDECLYNL